MADEQHSVPEFAFELPAHISEQNGPQLTRFILEGKIIMA
jgi:hypothetical protein